MAHHEHIEVFVHGVLGVRAGRIGRGRENLFLAADLDDVRGVSAAGALAVVGVNGPALESLDGFLHAARLVEGIGVDGDGHVVGLGDGEAVIDGGRGGTPVLVELHADSAGVDDVLQTLGFGGVPFAGEREIERQGIRSLQHHLHVVGRRSARRGAGSGRRSGPAAEQRGETAGDSLGGDLRADEVYVGVEAAGGEDAALARDCLRVHAHHHAWRHALHDVGVTSLAYARDHTVLDPHVRLVYASVVDDERVGDDGVERDGCVDAALLTHTLPQSLTASELALVAVHAQVLLHRDPQVGIAKTNLVPNGRAVHGGVLGAGDGEGRSLRQRCSRRDVEESPRGDPRHGLVKRVRRVHRPVHDVVTPAYDAVTRDWHQRHLFALARFESNRGTGGDVES
mmetsp:Transcript_11609/g.54024  ORF Transcript_11609/g.54024 Transcript_11609/m.54024 type:complete len:397 (-) Transcript_11609:22-1212(-)